MPVQIELQLRSFMMRLSITGPVLLFNNSAVEVEEQPFESTTTIEYVPCGNAGNVEDN
jgi:hypothetical protein